MLVVVASDFGFLAEELELGRMPSNSTSKGPRKVVLRGRFSYELKIYVL